MDVFKVHEEVIADCQAFTSEFMSAHGAKAIVVEKFLRFGYPRHPMRL